MKRRNAIYLMLSGLAGAIIYKSNKLNVVGGIPDYGILDKNMLILEDIVDLIIPETDSIGAKKANVHIYLIKITKECLPVSEANIVINGVKNISQAAKSKYGNEYSQCSSQQRRAVARLYISSNYLEGGVVQKVRNRITSRSFFSIIKYYTVEGFGTSREGATMALSYLPIPGKYIGCYKVNKNQKAWAT